MNLFGLSNVLSGVQVKEIDRGLSFVVVGVNKDGVPCFVFDQSWHSVVHCERITVFFFYQQFVYLALFGQLNLFRLLKADFHQKEVKLGLFFVFLDLAKPKSLTVSSFEYSSTSVIPVIWFCAQLEGQEFTFNFIAIVILELE